jgi:hypothetical protein
VRRIKYGFWIAAGFVVILPLIPVIAVGVAGGAVERAVIWLGRGRRWSMVFCNAADYCILQAERNS